MPERVHNPGIEDTNIEDVWATDEPCSKALCSESRVEQGIAATATESKDNGDTSFQCIQGSAAEVEKVADLENSSHNAVSVAKYAAGLTAQASTLSSGHSIANTEGEVACDIHRNDQDAIMEDVHVVEGAGDADGGQGTERAVSGEATEHIDDGQVEHGSRHRCDGDSEFTEADFSCSSPE